MKGVWRRYSCRLSWFVVGAVAIAMSVPVVAAGLGGTEPPAPSEPTTEVLDGPPAASEPAPAATTAVDEPAGSTDAPLTSDVPEPSDAPVATEVPAASDEVPAASEPVAASSEPECVAAVEGDGRPVVPAGCEPVAVPGAAANPSIDPACGLAVTVVADRSASVDGAAVSDAIGAVVDGLVDTGSTLAVVDFAAGVNLAVGPTEVSSDTRGMFGASATTSGASSNLAAGLSSAPRADLTIVVTDGIANAGRSTPDHALADAVAAANGLKNAGSRVFAIGVGDADLDALAAISGGTTGGDVGSSGHTVGNLDAVTASLNGLATGDCLMFAPLALVVAPNTGAIAVPATGSANQIGPASPYPSTITVSGETGLVTDVDVHLFGVTHGIGGDIDMLLVGPEGRNLILMSDIGATGTFVTLSNASITFDDSATETAPNNGTVTGAVSWRPVNGAGADSFPPPAPSPSTNTTLAGAFTGINPNGTWSLYVVDDATGDIGSIAGGWSLDITTEEAAVATTTAITSSVNPSLVGGNVTFTATVGSGGTPVTSGTVTFSVDGNPVASNVPVNPSGIATFNTTTLTEGTHLVRATYNGATGFLGSNGSVSQIVDTPTSTPATGQWCNTGAITGPASSGPATPYPSRITVSGAGTLTTGVTVQLGGISHTAPIDFDVLLVSPTGQNLVLMSDVGGQAPVNDVVLTFADGGGAIPAAGPLTSRTYSPSDNDSNTPADSFPAPAPIPSAASALSTFNGQNPNGVWQLFVFDDAGADAGSIGGGWCLNVSTAVPTATDLTSSLNPSTVGQPVTFTATVTSGGSAVTGGTVTFTDGATTLASDVAVNSSGQATVTTSSLAAGTHSITATYGGTAAYQTSNDTVSQVVNRAPTSTAVTSSPNPSVAGESVTFTAVVTSGGSPVTAGSVTFSEGATALASNVGLDGSGQATFTTSALAVGTHQITATFAETATLTTSNDSLDQVVSNAATATELTSSLNPSIFGESVTFTATVTITDGPSAGGPAVGAVTFTDGGSSLGAPVPLDGSGEATLTTSSLTTGTHSIVASYGGATGVAASNDSLDQVVSPAATTTVLTSSPNPSTFGRLAVFTATVTYSNGPNAGLEVTTGDITVTDTTTGTTLQTRPGSPMVVGLTSLTVGTHTITAEYSGTADIAASTASLDQVVDGVADAGGPYTIDEGQGLPLLGSESRGGPGAVYEWDLDRDGDFDDATGVTPTVTWARLEALGFDGDDPPVSRTVTLRLTDGPSFTAITSLTIVNVAPTATSLDAPTSAPEGSSPTVSVDASDPSAIDEADLEYRFDFGDDGTVDLVSDTASVAVPASFLPDGPGSLDISAVVVDPDGGVSAPVSATVAVTNASAAATIDGPSTAVVGEPVTIKVGAVDPSPDDMLGTFLFSVDWGDGSPVVTVPGPADPPVTHTYTAAGVYTVVAVVTDPDGGVGEPLEFTMTVVEQVTTTTTAPTTVPPAGTTTVPGALPPTGAGTSNLALVALALLGAGVVSILATRRSRTWATRLGDPGP